MFILVLVLILSFLTFLMHQLKLVIQGFGLATAIHLLLFGLCPFGLGKCSSLFSIRIISLFGGSSVRIREVLLILLKLIFGCQTAFVQLNLSFYAGRLY